MAVFIIAGIIAFIIGFCVGASGNGNGFIGVVFGGFLTLLVEVILFILSNS